jgi:hypothetical protein
MKDYPSVPNIDSVSARQMIKILKGTWAGSDKIDGSCIRAEWTQREKFYKFGTSSHLIDRTSPLFGEAVDLIETGFGEKLGIQFEMDHIKRAVAYFEFFGPHSFAGSHTDEPHKVLLIDLSIHDKGFVSPITLFKLEKLVPSARALCGGPVTQELIDQIKNRTLPKMTFEGVVFKRGEGTSREWFKCKSRDWLEKLRVVCGPDKEKFQRLR